MSMKKLLLSRKGLSVIELVVALSLLGIVLAVGYSYFFFGVNTFRIGETQSNLQRDIRLTSDFLTREVRNAVAISLYNSNSGLPHSADGNNYIYLDGSVIKHIDANGNQSSKTGNVIDTLIFDINLIEPDNNNKQYLLTFTISGSDNSQVYEIESEVYLNNIVEGSIAQSEGVLVVLGYKKP